MGSSYTPGRSTWPDAEQPRAAVALRAELRVGLAAHQQNVRRVGNRLGVVDDGGAAVQADHGREGRPDARDAALAFERLHQRRLFADLVRARAGLRDDVEVEAASRKCSCRESPSRTHRRRPSP